MGRGTKRLIALGAFAAFAIATGVAGAAGTLFQPYHAVDVGSWPEAVATGDVTGDGRTDVVMTTGYYSDPANDFRVWVFAQTEGGVLSVPVSYSTGGTKRPKSVAVGDITGDGRADVVVAIDGSAVQVYAQLADGTLGMPVSHPTPNARLVRLGQLDADGRLDVAALGWGTNTVSVLLNDGAGGLQAPVQYAARHAGYEDLEVGDVTGDGRHDLVVMSGQSYAVPNLSVLAQQAAGGFGAPAEYRVDTNLEATFNTKGIGIGELSGDDRLDVVASFGGNQPSSRMAFFTQTEEGTLADPIVYTSYDIPEPVEVGDVDLDGRADVVTLHGGWNRAGVYPQHVVGGFAGEDLYPIPYASHYESHGLALDDVSGDGRPDVVLADYNNGLVVLYSEPAEPPPPPPPPPVADVGVDVTASGSRVRPKKSFWFDVKVTNAGPDPTAAALVVQLTGGATSLIESSSDCTLQAQTVTCSYAALASGASTTVRVSGIAPKSGTVRAAASVDGAVDDPNAANDTDSASIAVR
jgi:hypothetical protein